MSKSSVGYTMFAVATNNSYGITFNNEYLCVEVFGIGDYAVRNDSLNVVIVPKSLFSATKQVTETTELDDTGFVLNLNDVLDVRSMFDQRGKYNKVPGRIKIVKRFKSPSGVKLYSINTETYGPDVKITVTESQIISILRDMSAEVWKTKAIIDRTSKGMRYVGDYVESTAIEKAGIMLNNGLIKEASIRELRDAFGKVSLNIDKVSLWVLNHYQFNK